MKNLIFYFLVTMVYVTSMRLIKREGVDKDRGKTMANNINSQYNTERKLVNKHSNRSSNNRSSESALSSYTLQSNSLASSTQTIFLAGLGDKSFIITSVMACKYSDLPLTVLFSSIASLILMGFISVQLGLTLPTYIPTYTVDFCAVLAFTAIGIKMIINGVKIDSRIEKEKLEIAQREMNKEVFKENEILAEITKKEQCFDNNYQNSKTILKQCVEVFCQSFTLIFLSELGEKSQLSTIYLNANSDPKIIFYALVLAQVSLTLLAIVIGVMISSYISERKLNMIAGAMFLTFGVISMYLTYIKDFVIINKALHCFIVKYSAKKDLNVIPDKESLSEGFLLNG